MKQVRLQLQKFHHQIQERYYLRLSADASKTNDIPSFYLNCVNHYTSGLKFDHIQVFVNNRTSHYIAFAFNYLNLERENRVFMGYCKNSEKPTLDSGSISFERFKEMLNAFIAKGIPTEAVTIEDFIKKLEEHFFSVEVLANEHEKVLAKEPEKPVDVLTDEPKDIEQIMSEFMERKQREDMDYFLAKQGHEAKVARKHLLEAKYGNLPEINAAEIRLKELVKQIDALTKEASGLETLINENKSVVMANNELTLLDNEIESSKKALEKKKN